MPKINKGGYLKEKIEHIDIKKHDTRALINDMSKMSFSARDLARASDIYDMMLKDKKCTIFLTLAGSTSVAGCMQVYVDMVKNNMVDAIVSTGASIADMDFFEALGNRHYKGTPEVDDADLRNHLVDRIYDTFIDEEALEKSDLTIKEIADGLEARTYAPWELIYEMGKWLSNNPKRAKKQDSLIQVAYEHNVPIFCPSFSDSGAGFGIALHYMGRPDSHLVIDTTLDFISITKLKIQAETTGLLMVGGGVPKNFTQDTVIAAEMFGKVVDMHKYTVQITVADVRDGALSSSTLKEAGSWGKVSKTYEQMVFSEATMSVPLLAAYGYHSGGWKKRKHHNYIKFLKRV
ncbi:deoxyhypusine synthase [Candidatus Kaiserbacteria bacterium RIFOXYD1_FULL_42_15]|uniref:Deoxyhypusine synthase-like protein n=1 Tax=Candidatus Kaiserbacteria bacterium RIFOXYD1_FULL_42_15 TaxID=1798532 RepID=A0A1F6FR76_9BACT|nr:MAG: deoxyhypusine synthase [Candidatus Kaiserbacteria bacterium RIFOXYD1_FULL_42_15]